MARDFAKEKSRKAPARKKTTARRGTARQSAGLPWRPYVIGVLSGIFISFLAYLAMLPKPGEPVADQQNPDQPAAQPPRPRFDFYTRLPTQRIEVEVEPEPLERATTVNKPRAGASKVYLLQAGSFRQREDADRRRAELLLLGLEPSVEESTGDNGRWYRVYLGPFETQSSMSRARGLTAGQNIDTLLLKRDQP